MRGAMRNHLVSSSLWGRGSLQTPSINSLQKECWERSFESQEAFNGIFRSNFSSSKLWDWWDEPSGSTLNNMKKLRVRLYLPQMKIGYLCPAVIHSLVYGAQILQGGLQIYGKSLSDGGGLHLDPLFSWKMLKITWRQTAPLWPSIYRSSRTHIISAWVWNKLTATLRQWNRWNLLARSYLFETGSVKGELQHFWRVVGHWCTEDPVLGQPVWPNDLLVVHGNKT